MEVEDTVEEDGIMSVFDHIEKRNYITLWFNTVSGIAREGRGMSSWMNGGGDGWNACDTRDTDIFNVCDWGSTNS